MEYEDGATPAHIASSDVEFGTLNAAADGVSDRLLALASVELAIKSAGGTTLSREDFDEIVMPRAARIRRWVLACESAPGVESEVQRVLVERSSDA